MKRKGVVLKNGTFSIKVKGLPQPGLDLDRYISDWVLDAGLPQFSTCCEGRDVISPAFKEALIDSGFCNVTAGNCSGLPTTAVPITGTSCPVSYPITYNGNTYSTQSAFVNAVQNAYPSFVVSYNSSSCVFYFTGSGTPPTSIPVTSSSCPCSFEIRVWGCINPPTGSQFNSDLDPYYFSLPTTHLGLPAVSFSSPSGSCSSPLVLNFKVRANTHPVFGSTPIMWSAGFPMTTTFSNVMDSTCTGGDVAYSLLTCGISLAELNGQPKLVTVEFNIPECGGSQTLQFYVLP